MSYNSRLLWVVLVHDTRSSDAQSKDAQFMNKLYLSLHVINRLIGGYSLHRNEKLKDFTE